MGGTLSLTGQGVFDAGGGVCYQIVAPVFSPTAVGVVPAMLCDGLLRRSDLFGGVVPQAVTAPIGNGR